MTVARAWQRIKEHKVIQWGVAYFAAALALAHAQELIAHAYEWPEIVGQILIGLLVLGFLVALVLAWYHGHKGLTSFSAAEMSILAALLIVGAGMLYVFVRPAEHALTASAETTAQHSPATRSGQVSVAVLPFVNLSSDKEQEFFSDGMTEEITSALAKVQGLNVVARTSAFQFKNTNKDMRSIGQALGASHLIEGSVRKEGNEVRITAQLIKTDDGTHLWTESYDRELKGVFALQEEIATAIAGALRVPLGLKEGQSLIASRTDDTESYQIYLRARALVRERGPLEPGGPLTQAANLLRGVVARDPDYAPAWAMLAQAYSLTPNFSGALFRGSTDELRRIASDTLQKAEAAAQQAKRLDPNNGDVYLALGQVWRHRGKWFEAEDAFKQALSIDPGNPDALQQYSTMLAVLGRLKEALPLRRRLQAQEPFVPQFNRNTAQILWENGRNDEAIAILKQLPPSHFSLIVLAEVYSSMGRYNDAAVLLQGIPSGIFPPGMVEQAVRLLRAAPGRAASPPTTLSKGRLSFVYLYSGAPDRSLDFFQGLNDAGALGTTYPSVLWAPAFAPVRNSERFKTLVRRAGQVDYWRARGWPEFCHPTTGDDFVCH